MNKNRNPEELKRSKLPSIHHPDISTPEEVKQSHLGANLEGVEESDFDEIVDEDDVT